jgi:hypothetical protein
MLDKLMNLDRRIVFILIALGVIIPTFLDVKFPIMVSQPTRDIHERIESLPPGTTIILAFDYGPGSMPELHPMAKAVLTHCFRKKVRVIGMTLIPEGATLGDEMIREVATTTGAVYGEDYVYLGYRSGSELVLREMGSSISAVYESDYAETPLTELPMMQEITNYEQINLVIDLASGESVESWILYANTRFNQEIAAGVTGVMVSQMYPYLQTDQLIGLMSGLMGAAEYERLVEMPGKGTKGMSVQSFVHLLVAALVIWGNIVFFIQRRRASD